MSALLVTPGPHGKWTYSSMYPQATVSLHGASLGLTVKYSSHTGRKWMTKQRLHLQQLGEERRSKGLRAPTSGPGTWGISIHPPTHPSIHLLIH